MPENDSRKPLDLRGMSCAFVLPEVDQALADYDMVTALCDHPTTIHQTMPQYCRSHGYKLTMKPEIYPLHSQAYRLSISKSSG